MLLVGDAVDSDEFMLTQEFISQMLGTRRAGVTTAAGTLSQAECSATDVAKLQS
jgi:hypothetical protein